MWNVRRFFRVAILGATLGLALIASTASRSDALTSYRKAVSSAAFGECNITCYDCSANGMTLYSRYMAPLNNDASEGPHACESGHNPCGGCDAFAAAAIPDVMSAVESSDPDKLRIVLSRLRDRAEINSDSGSLLIKDCGGELLIASVPLNSVQVAVAAHALEQGLSN